VDNATPQEESLFDMSTSSGRRNRVAAVAWGLSLLFLLLLFAFPNGLVFFVLTVSICSALILTGIGLTEWVNAGTKPDTRRRY